MTIFDKVRKSFATSFEKVISTSKSMTVELTFANSMK